MSEARLRKRATKFESLCFWIARIWLWTMIVGLAFFFGCLFTIALDLISESFTKATLLSTFAASSDPSSPLLFNEMNHERLSDFGCEPITGVSDNIHPAYASRRQSKALCVSAGLRQCNKDKANEMGDRALLLYGQNYHCSVAHYMSLQTILVALPCVHAQGFTLTPARAG
jgi:hypothetical protein